MGASTISSNSCKDHDIFVGGTAFFPSSGAADVPSVQLNFYQKCNEFQLHQVRFKKNAEQRKVYASKVRWCN